MMEYMYINVRPKADE